MSNPDPHAPAAPAAPAPGNSGGHADTAAVNQSQLAACARAEALLPKVRARLALFAPEEIDETFLSALESDCALFRALATRGQVSTNTKEGYTAAEETAHLAAVVAAQDVQSRARQKYAATDPNRLAAFHVNHRLSGVPYATFIQYVQDMVNLVTGDAATPADPLPGMTPARLATLQEKRAAYLAAHNAQTAEQQTASQARIERNAKIAAITANRLKVQFVADRLFPYQVAGNAAVRREFSLTEGRPFVG